VIGHLRDRLEPTGSDALKGLLDEGRDRFVANQDFAAAGHALETIA